MLTDRELLEDFEIPYEEADKWKITAYCERSYGKCKMVYILEKRDKDEN
jgi:hypothetical protein